MNKYLPQAINPYEIADIFVEMTSLLFDQLPLPINFVDQNGNIIVMNQAFLDFLGLGMEDIIGKHITEIDPAVRLPIVLKTGKAEIGQKHRFHDGREAIVHRIPLFYKNVIIGGVGIILTENLSYFHDFLSENETIKQLKNVVRKTSDIYKAKYTFDDILTQCNIANDCKERAKTYSTNDFPVLITGESGVGKELFAHSIHQSSKRKNEPFVRVNCAAIPESLIESELFGYEKGAFTGAQKNGKVGKFQLADRGTIFLDEIGDLPLPLQAKLLRVLQEKEVEKIGSNEIISLDIRIIAATNCNLHDKIKEGKFRQDLYYRLNVLNLEVPSLRDRKKDIPLLINHFMTRMHLNSGIYKIFPDEIINIFTKYPWPGNIRELKNTVERLAVNAARDTISINDVPKHMLKQQLINYSIDGQSVLNEDSSLKEMISKLEKDIILTTLKKYNFSRTETAKALDIPRMTLYRKLKEYGFNEY